MAIILFFFPVRKGKEKKTAKQSEKGEQRGRETEHRRDEALSDRLADHSRSLSTVGWDKDGALLSPFGLLVVVFFPLFSCSTDKQTARAHSVLVAHALGDLHTRGKERGLDKLDMHVSSP